MDFLVVLFYLSQEEESSFVFVLFPFYRYEWAGFPFLFFLSPFFIIVIEGNCTIIAMKWGQLVYGSVSR